MCALISFGFGAEHSSWCIGSLHSQTHVLAQTHCRQHVAVLVSDVMICKYFHLRCLARMFCIVSDDIEATELSI